jgi:hypothetical protein
MQETDEVKRVLEIVRAVIREHHPRDPWVLRGQPTMNEIARRVREA